tara:strand:- start:296 stop:628 length:333 start_codon:yes stop_codon:yes gene_type:complete
MNIKHTARNYFSKFEQKDLEGLSDMFHENVSLKDWNICVDGKQSVLDANADIFNSVGELRVNVENLYISDMTVVAELSIYVNNDPALPVVDIINFNSDMKIKSIVAYRGN